ncbi:cation-translocating P-type ATPase [Azohydromonas lata]|uniref:HAD-IC family P-type ATPase n=1 Tax=Azohydromonas lata TaxID=45677 RepID=A0ABU5IQ72_9BURK|nr:HAD-IC family P-type ATPase [Azohydromonas lata]MDZ5461046.1 HAD-IC family P-type ATPase [Azohydromonas lata]
MPEVHDTPAPVPWHALPADEALRCLHGDAARGLDAAQAARRLQRDGANELPQAPPTPWWRQLLHQFASPLIALLAGAAALSLAMGHVSDAGVILAVVLVNALIGLAQEGRAERSMAALRRLAVLQARVLRGGVETLVPARELVSGDVLLLAAGDAVTADARLLQAAQVQAAEAALTGESVPVMKAPAALPADTALADRQNMLWAGTQLTAGRALAVVVATGARTQIGAIARLTEGTREPPTPLEQRIAQFGRRLVVAGMVLFVGVMALGLSRGMAAVELLMVAVSQMVSLVPEGLPVAMTIALAVGMQRMAGRGALIRRLSAVETLGATSVICTDKTGTLTRNEMTACALWLADGTAATVTGAGYAPTGELRAEGAPLPAAALWPLLRAAVLCNDAQLLPPDAGDGAWTVLGDPTEGALLVLAAKASLDATEERAQLPRAGEIPFDADTKLMATLHHDAAGALLQLKGAPEALLRLCGDAGAVQAARAAAEGMAQRALRVLAIAEVRGAAADGAVQAAARGGAEAAFAGLAGQARLLGLIGQIDPPREEARQAVAECREAGIRTLMLTGDHKLTGLAIARELGIARDGDLALDGAELQRLSDAELQALLPRLAVCARVQPAQKLRIVEALQSHGEVVAMTGDGVNDAPALARADVGVAMGIAGTEVAKSAARVVLTDDNFATLVAAVEQGRVVRANLGKLLVYLFATSLDEVVVLLLALLAGYPLPLAAVQILWINLVTEGTVTINLVMEPAEGDEMRHPPRPRLEPLLGAAQLWRLALLVPVSSAITFGWFAWRTHLGAPADVVQTQTFTLLAMTQWFNVLNCQSATRSALNRSLLRNRWLLGGLLLSVALQAAVLWWGPLNALFHTVPLGWDELWPLPLAASVVLWVEEARKALARRRLGRARRSGGLSADQGLKAS